MSNGFDVPRRDSHNNPQGLTAQELAARLQAAREAGARKLAERIVRPKQKPGGAGR